jgi:GH25 family lysozyme M1 (1,4-beta-N-acetylmuramidase)
VAGVAVLGLASAAPAAASPVSPPPPIPAASTSPPDSSGPLVGTAGQFVRNEVSAARKRLGRNLAASVPGRVERLTHPEADHSGSALGAQPQAAPHTESAGSVRGLDVSSHQKAVDWSRVRDRGAGFAYAKASEGTYYTNPYFAQQYNGSRQAGLVRGAYHFAVPSNSGGAAQADYFIAHGGAWSPDGKTLPGMLDLEGNPYGPRCYGQTSTQLVAWIKGFAAEYHSETSRYPVIYTNATWWADCTADSGAFSGHDPLWVAHYAAKAGPLPGGWQHYTFWQDGDAGRFPGDQDVFNGSRDRLLALARGRAGSGGAAGSGGGLLPVLGL